MESSGRAPLTDRPTNGVVRSGPMTGGSKLPTPGSRSRSRLAQPGSISKMPMPKRKASPDTTLPTFDLDESHNQGAPPLSKRPRHAVGASNTSFDSGKSVATLSKRPGLRRSMSTSSINTMGTAAKTNRMARQTSGSSVGVGAAGRNTSVRGAVSRPAATRPTPGTRPGTTSTMGRPKATATRPGTAKPPTGKTATAPTTGAAPGGGGGKKRAPWDLKGRLLDMEQTMSSHLTANSQLQDAISTNNDRIQLLESLNKQLKGTVQAKEAETSEASQSISQLKNALSEKEHELSVSRRRWEEEMDELRRKSSRQIEDLECSKASLERQRTGLETELACQQQEIAGLKMTVAQLSTAQEGIKAQLEATKASLSASQTDAASKQETIERLNGIISSQEACISTMEGKLREHEMSRRQLHNAIQELKGNIRVFCRVRPLLRDEKLGVDEINHIAFDENDPRSMELEKLADLDPNQSVASGLRHGANGRYQFQFDRVFSPTSTQKEVFDEISQLVQSALDGYNVCIFAYGQTGSGKTFTMEGPEKPDEVTEGMIPRAVAQIFESVEHLDDKGWKYEFTASFLEIYNESIRDLLGENGHEDVKHEIRMVSSKNSEICVTNLTTVPVPNAQKVHELLHTASRNRAVAATKCNERSSRSHSVFQLRIHGTNQVTTDTCAGILNLIDLAGSERLKDSKSEGARLKETQCINKSLSNLGNVIMALANKESHIPYRNSKLTHLLMNSLGGNSKTLMFVNVSPKEECFGETLNSLRFATKVNNCNIGTATQRKK